MRLSRGAGPLIALTLALAGCAAPETSTDVSGLATKSAEATPWPSETFTVRTDEPTPEPEESSAIPVRRAVVTHIVDGDTFDVSLNGSTERIRFIGVDTPERGRAFFARATEYTASKAPVGSTVYLELDVEHRDRYGRLLAYVWLARPRTGRNLEAIDNMLNARLVRRGLAKTLTIQPNSNYADLFATLQKRAREDELNLWGDPVLPMSAPKPTSPGKCHPNYSGKCLKPDSYDYDCEGGSGDGPDYTDGPVYVQGDDPYDLDRDGDGVACE